MERKIFNLKDKKQKTHDFVPSLWYGSLNDLTSFSKRCTWEEKKDKHRQPYFLQHFLVSKTTTLWETSNFFAVNQSMSELNSKQGFQKFTLVFFKKKKTSRNEKFWLVEFSSRMLDDNTDFVPKSFQKAFWRLRNVYKRFLFKN